MLQPICCTIETILNQGPYEASRKNVMDNVFLRCSIGSLSNAGSLTSRSDAFAPKSPYDLLSSSFRLLKVIFVIVAAAIEVPLVLQGIRGRGDPLAGCCHHWRRSIEIFKLHVAS